MIDMSDSSASDTPAIIAMREVLRWLLWREFTRDLEARHEVQDLFVEYTAEAAERYLNAPDLQPEEQQRRREIADELQRLRQALMAFQFSVAGLLSLTYWAGVPPWILAT